jgi:ssDNA-binding Zn-finger/Zn-ribbon topoisomerase 1
MKIVSYRYALDSDSLVCIDSFTGSASERKIYKCPACHQDFIPAMGKRNQWHFRHKGYDLSVLSVSEQCPYDTYLRIISRTLFYQSYKSASNNQQPIIIEYYKSEICNCEYTECENHFLQSFDLTHKFEVILEPPSDRKRYPNLYLADDTGIKIHILMLTHKEDVPSDLISSKERIISFRVPDEDSLSRFKPIKKISVDDDGTSYYNFNVTKTVDLKLSCNKYPQLKREEERKIQAEKERLEREERAKRELLERTQRMEAEKKCREYFRNYPTHSFEEKYIGPATFLHEGYYFSVDFSGKCEFIWIEDLDCFFGQIPNGYYYLKHYTTLKIFKPKFKDLRDSFYSLTSFLKDKSPIKIADCYLCENCELSFNSVLNCPQRTDNHLKALTCQKFKLWFDRFL